MNGNISITILKAVLVLLSIMQLAVSAVLHFNHDEFRNALFPAPIRLLVVFGIQVLVASAASVVTKQTLKQILPYFAFLATLCCVAIYFVQVPYVAGKNVDVVKIKNNVECVILVVVLVGFSILNFLIALRLPDATWSTGVTKPPEVE